MSYRGLGLLPAISPTTMFAQAVDPYAFSQVPPGSVYAPYGWGPDFMYGMPMNYQHHIGYERTPVPGARRIGPMYDVVNPYLGEGGVGDDGDGLGFAGLPVRASVGAYYEIPRGIGQYEADYRQLGAARGEERGCPDTYAPVVTSEGRWYRNRCVAARDYRLHLRHLPSGHGYSIMGQRFVAGLDGILAVL